MPSLVRFIVLCAVLAVIAFGAMLALDLLVEPRPREMSFPVASDRVNP